MSEAEPPKPKQSPQTDFEEDVLSLFRQRSSVVIAIMGRRETGKTDLALTIAEIVYRYRIICNLATNIRFLDSPIPIEYIQYFDLLESWCQHTTGRNLFILDEAGKAFKRRRPMSDINLEWIEKLQTLRKFGPLSLLFTFPAEKYIDNTALGSDVLDVSILKVHPKHPQKAYWFDLMESQSWRYDDLPRSPIKFDTYDSADFSLSSPKNVPKFKDEEKQFLWDVFTKVKTGLTPAERKRKQRLTEKFMLEVLGRERDK